MPDRTDEIARFLAHAGWGEARRTVLAGDASNRRYDRLVTADGSRAVLMDAPADRGEDVRPFVRIAQHLSACGLAAPEILAQDETRGFLLLEDLGDAIFARVLERDPTLETDLYAGATDVLLKLHAAPRTPEVASYLPEMADLSQLAWRWYRMEVDGAAEPAGRPARDAMQNALDSLPPWEPVLILRDYHAENLIWRPERIGTDRVALLDFQDARMGHPAYDLVSLLEDARRDVSPEVQRQMVDRYVAAAGTDREAFEAGYAVMGAQRNLRILGVFARLSMHFGKPHYVDLIPRVWGHLQTDLAHPACAALAAQVRATLPEPTPDHLKTLKDKCATIPHP
ncbi:hypothetical protein SAMN04490244_105225 [Tranquillimonas rosea]|uniref:Aminoglycoside phosphotransferase domain-containing protein n=1 Tax=Tranquillimonas rosea TaxID=641238 RepID=A0A1H9UEB0_9RHOB|nr:phosphotransferase [Tranquillimonas rosea]SES07692.1 hypothetical protein SAMN04490244_105225 [Tranquillimonas rosea]